jgi:hypothetical protein
MSRLSNHQTDSSIYGKTCEQTLRGELAHLRAKWAPAFLTHCPQHRGLQRFCWPDCREPATMFAPQASIPTSRARAWHPRHWL